MHIPGIGLIITTFTLINIYYWCIFYPGTLPYLFLFCLGVLHDTLVGTPLGFSSFIYIVFAFWLSRKRRTLRTAAFSAIWLGFIIYSGGIFLLEWLIISVYSGKLLPLKELTVLWCLSGISYPVIHLLLTRIHHPRT